MVCISTSHGGSLARLTRLYQSSLSLSVMDRISMSDVREATPKLRKVILRLSFGVFTSLSTTMLAKRGVMVLLRAVLSMFALRLKKTNVAHQHVEFRRRPDFRTVCQCIMPLIRSCVTDGIRTTDHVHGLTTRAENVTCWRFEFTFFELMKHDGHLCHVMCVN